MRVGSRWPVGGTPPAGLPAPLLDAVRAEEAQLPQDGDSAESWTLTWLEGRPRLALGRAGVELWVDSAGSVRRSPSAPGGAVTAADGSLAANPEQLPEDDDDDWLL